MSGSNTEMTTPDWSDNAVNNCHIWSNTSASNENCPLADAQCTRTGPRVKCTVCKTEAHTKCLSELGEKEQLTCRPTFREAQARQYREKATVLHHWVRRKSEKGKCKQCGKAFQSKLSFSCRDAIIVSCSWCKVSYHNKSSCFHEEELANEECDLGNMANIIVPPTWIVKIPPNDQLHSSLSKQIKSLADVENRESKRVSFVVKPVHSPNLKPLLVFINPKSGGNQGIKLLQKFQWLLNPRQVFDLTQGGPKMGLEMFKKVPNIRVLACGGDGTVGWVLSIIDQLNFMIAPPVAVLPLGTGNDLARSLGWGGGYTDEPISKILSNIGESQVSELDRWNIDVKENAEVQPNKEGKTNLPLNVLNNYYSVGVDAHIALEFHQAREAHPEKFNSRLRNKMFYGQMGGKDLLVRKWKGLADYVTLVCDGQDLTGRLKQLRVHAILFLNISSYGGGTHPWPRGSHGESPSTKDGLIEVIGLTTYQLPLLQAGGHGSVICQCKVAVITTTKTIPMQVDGEACRLNPSIITISLLNTVPMLAKRKLGRSIESTSKLVPLNLAVHRISFTDYENNYNNKEGLVSSAEKVGDIEVSPVATLDEVRNIIDQAVPTNNDSSEWRFLDSCTAHRFFRIDNAQEAMHYVTDIANEIIYILQPEEMTDNEEPMDIGNSEAGLNGDSPTHGDPMTPKKSRYSRNTEMRNGDISEKMVDKENMINRTSNSQPRVIVVDSNIKSPVNERLKIEYSSVSLQKTSDEIIKAAKSGDLKKLKGLHSQGYSLLSIDRDGYTALHYSSMYGYRDIVQYLTAKAPSTLLHMKERKKGQSALHTATESKQHKVCWILVAAGASLTQLDDLGNTPKSIAIKAKDYQLAAYYEGKTTPSKQCHHHSHSYKCKNHQSKSHSRRDNSRQLIAVNSNKWELANSGRVKRESSRSKK